MDELGRITPDGETRTLSFVRRLAAPPDEVWAALTESDRLADWLTAAAVEPSAGGDVSFDFGENGTMTGKVTAWEPGRLLEYGWRFPDGHDSRVRWELAPAGAGTALRLQHSLLAPDAASGYGAGWHAFLDRLAGHLSDEPTEWQPRFEALLPQYESLTGSSS